MNLSLFCKLLANKNSTASVICVRSIYSHNLLLRVGDCTIYLSFCNDRQ
jgi:hypothetical protein